MAKDLDFTAKATADLHEAAQNDALGKLIDAWNSKNAKAAKRVGTFGFMAATLAACGGSGGGGNEGGGTRTDTDFRFLSGTSGGLSIQSLAVPSLDVATADSRDQVLQVGGLLGAPEAPSDVSGGLNVPEGETFVGDISLFDANRGEGIEVSGEGNLWLLGTTDFFAGETEQTIILAIDLAGGRLVFDMPSDAYRIIIDDASRINLSGGTLQISDGDVLVSAENYASWNVGAPLIVNSSLTIDFRGTTLSADEVNDTLSSLSAETDAGNEDSVVRILVDGDDQAQLVFDALQNNTALSSTTAPKIEVEAVDGASVVVDLEAIVDSKIAFLSISVDNQISLLAARLEGVIAGGDATNATAIANVAGDLAALTATVATLQDLVDSNDAAQTAALAAAQETLEGLISALSTRVTDEVARLEGLIGENAEDVVTNAGAIVSLQEALEALSALVDEKDAAQTEALANLKTALEGYADTAVTDLETKLSGGLGEGDYATLKDLSDAVAALEGIDTGDAETEGTIAFRLAALKGELESYTDGEIATLKAALEGLGEGSWTEGDYQTLSALNGAVQALEGALGEGAVSDQLDELKTALEGYTDTAVSDLETKLSGGLGEGDYATLKDLSDAVAALEGIDTGDAGTEGTIAFRLAALKSELQGYADTEIATLKAALEGLGEGSWTEGDYQTLSALNGAVQALEGALGEGAVSDQLDELKTALEGYADTAVSDLETKMSGGLGEGDYATLKDLSDAVAALEGIDTGDAETEGTIAFRLAALKGELESYTDGEIATLRAALEGLGEGSWTEGDYQTLSALNGAVQALEGGLGEGSASDQLDELKTALETYADDAVTALETQLLDGVSTDFDTLKELADAIVALRTLIGGSELGQNDTDLIGRIEDLEAAIEGTTPPTLTDFTGDPLEFTVADIFGSTLGSTTVLNSFVSSFEGAIAGVRPETVELTVTGDLTVAQAVALAQAGLAVNTENVTYSIRDAYTTIQSALTNPDANATMAGATEVVAFGNSNPNTVDMMAFGPSISLRIESGSGDDTVSTGAGDHTIYAAVGADTIWLTPTEDDTSRDTVVYKSSYEGKTLPVTTVTFSSDADIYREGSDLTVTINGTAYTYTTSADETPQEALQGLANVLTDQVTGALVIDGPDGIELRILGEDGKRLTVADGSGADEAGNRVPLVVNDGQATVWEVTFPDDASAWPTQTNPGNTTVFDREFEVTIDVDGTIYTVVADVAYTSGMVDVTASIANLVSKINETAELSDAVTASSNNGVLTITADAIGPDSFSVTGVKIEENGVQQQTTIEFSSNDADYYEGGTVSIEIAGRTVTANMVTGDASASIAALKAEIDLQTSGGQRFVGVPKTGYLQFSSDVDETTAFNTSNATHSMYSVYITIGDVVYVYVQFLESVSINPQSTVTPERQTDIGGLVSDLNEQFAEVATFNLDAENNRIAFTTDPGNVVHGIVPDQEPTIEFFPAGVTSVDQKVITTAVISEGISDYVDVPRNEEIAAVLEVAKLSVASITNTEENKVSGTEVNGLDIYTYNVGEDRTFFIAGDQNTYFGRSGATYRIDSSLERIPAEFVPDAQSAPATAYVKFNSFNEFINSMKLSETGQSILVDYDLTYDSGNLVLSEKEGGPNIDFRPVFLYFGTPNDGTGLILTAATEEPDPFLATGTQTYEGEYQQATISLEDAATYNVRADGTDVPADREVDVYFEGGKIYATITGHGDDGVLGGGDDVAHTVSADMVEGPFYFVDKSFPALTGKTLGSTFESANSFPALSLTVGSDSDDEKSFEIDAGESLGDFLARIERDEPEIVLATFTEATNALYLVTTVPGGFSVGSSGNTTGTNLSFKSAFEVNARALADAIETETLAGGALFGVVGGVSLDGSEITLTAANSGKEAFAISNVRLDYQGVKQIATFSLEHATSYDNHSDGTDVSGAGRGADVYYEGGKVYATITDPGADVTFGTPDDAVVTVSADMQTGRGAAETTSQALVDAINEAINGFEAAPLPAIVSLDTNLRDGATFEPGSGTIVFGFKTDPHAVNFNFTKFGVASDLFAAYTVMSYGSGMPIVLSDPSPITYESFVTYLDSIDIDAGNEFSAEIVDGDIVFTSTATGETAYLEIALRYVTGLSDVKSLVLDYGDWELTNGTGEDFEIDVRKLESGVVDTGEAGASLAADPILSALLESAALGENGEITLTAKDPGTQTFEVSDVRLDYQGVKQIATVTLEDATQYDSLSDGTDATGYGADVYFQGGKVYATITPTGGVAVSVVADMPVSSTFTISTASDISSASAVSGDRFQLRDSFNFDSISTLAIDANITTVGELLIALSSLSVVEKAELVGGDIVITADEAIKSIQVSAIGIPLEIAGEQVVQTAQEDGTRRGTNTDEQTAEALRQAILDKAELADVIGSVTRDGTKLTIEAKNPGEDTFSVSDVRLDYQGVKQIATVDFNALDDGNDTSITYFDGGKLSAVIDTTPEVDGDVQNDVVIEVEMGEDAGTSIDALVEKINALVVAGGEVARVSSGPAVTEETTLLGVNEVNVPATAIVVLSNETHGGLGDNPDYNWTLDSTQSFNQIDYKVLVNDVLWRPDLAAAPVGAVENFITFESGPRVQLGAKLGDMITHFNAQFAGVATMSLSNFEKDGQTYSAITFETVNEGSTQQIEIREFPFAFGDISPNPSPVVTVFGADAPRIYDAFDADASLETITFSYQEEGGATRDLSFMIEFDPDREVATLILNEGATELGRQDVLAENGPLNLNAVINFLNGVAPPLPVVFTIDQDAGQLAMAARDEAAPATVTLRIDAGAEVSATYAPEAAALAEVISGATVDGTVITLTSADKVQQQFTVTAATASDPAKPEITDVTFSNSDADYFVTGIDPNETAGRVSLTVDGLTYVVTMQDTAADTLNALLSAIENGQDHADSITGLQVAHPDGLAVGPLTSATVSLTDSTFTFTAVADNDPLNIGASVSVDATRQETKINFDAGFDDGDFISGIGRDVSVTIGDQTFTIDGATRLELLEDLEAQLQAAITADGEGIGIAAVLNGDGISLDTEAVTLTLTARYGENDPLEVSDVTRAGFNPDDPRNVLQEVQFGFTNQYLNALVGSGKILTVNLGQVTGEYVVQAEDTAAAIVIGLAAALQNDPLVGSAIVTEGRFIDVSAAFPGPNVVGSATSGGDATVRLFETNGTTVEITTGFFAEEAVAGAIFLDEDNSQTVGTPTEITAGVDFDNADAEEVTLDTTQDAKAETDEAVDYTNAGLGPDDDSNFLGDAAADGESGVQQSFVNPDDSYSQIDNSPQPNGEGGGDGDATFFGDADQDVGEGGNGIRQTFTNPDNAYLAGEGSPQDGTFDAEGGDATYFGDAGSDVTLVGEGDIEGGGVKQTYINPDDGYTAIDGSPEENGEGFGEGNSDLFGSEPGYYDANGLWTPYLNGGVLPDPTENDGEGNNLYVQDAGEGDLTAVIDITEDAAGHASSVAAGDRVEADQTKDGFDPFDWGDGEGADASEVTLLSRGSEGPDIIHNFQVDHDVIAIEGALLESLVANANGYVVLGLDAGVAALDGSPVEFDLSLDSYAVIAGGEALTVSQLGDAEAVSDYVTARLDTSYTVDNDKLNATIFVVTAQEDTSKAAVWVHQQSDTGDSSVDALELTQLAEMNLVGGAFTVDNLLLQGAVIDEVIDVETDVVALRAPLAVKTLVELETTTPATPYEGAFLRRVEMEVDYETLELTIDFGFIGNEWETVTLDRGSIEIKALGVGTSWPLNLLNFSDRLVFDTAEQFFNAFSNDVTGYRLEEGNFIVSLVSPMFATDLNLGGSFIRQELNGVLLPSVDLARDEFALIVSAESTLDATELDDASAVATLLNARYTFLASAAETPRSTIFAVAARDDVSQVAFWEHRQSEIGDGSVTAEELVPLGRFTTENGELSPGNLAPVIPLEAATLIRDEFPDVDWALVDRDFGTGTLQNEDDADGQYTRLVALDVLVEGAADWQISNQGVDDFLAALRTVHVEVTGNTDVTAHFDVSASNASSVAGPGTDFLGALESITVINSADGDVSVSLSVTGGDYFMQSLRSIHLETTSLGRHSAAMSLSASRVDQLGGDYFMPALETITMVVPSSGGHSLSINNAGGVFFMESLRSILVENLGGTWNLSMSASANFVDQGGTGDHFMAALETITIRADGPDSSVSMSIENSGGTHFLASLKSITVLNADETVELSISADANFVNQGGRGENFMSALETITITSDGQDSSVSVSISHSGGAFFMQSLKAVVLEGREDVEMELAVSHNFLGADNFEVMRSLETIELRAGVEGKASLEIEVEHADFFMKSLKSVLVETESSKSAHFEVDNSVDSDAVSSYGATQMGDDFMTALETITVRSSIEGAERADVDLSNEEGDRFMDALHTIEVVSGSSAQVELLNDNGHDFLGALETIEMKSGSNFFLRFANLAGDRFATALEGVALDGGGTLQLLMSNQSGADFLTSFSLIDLSGREAGSSSTVNTGGAIDHALEVRVGGGDLIYNNGAAFDTLSKVYTDLGNDEQETFTFTEDDQGLLDFGLVVIKGFNWTGANASVRDVLDFSEAGIGLEDLDWAVDAEDDGLAHLRITSEEFAGEIVLEGYFTDFAGVNLQEIVQTQQII